ncbi:MAG: energy transducer TonB [Candidatus Margulisbacteria bacterium]|nr:energy transducer TonB [Candidatus Margulisiibacteriota bacterium]
MKNKYFFAFIISLLIHIAFFIVLSVLQLNFNPVKQKEVFREVSFVYEREFPQSPNSNKTILAQKQQETKKEKATIKQKKSTVAAKDKKPQEKVEKIKLPEVKESPKQEEQKTAMLKEDAKQNNNKFVTEPLSNEPENENRKYDKDIPGGTTGNQLADIRPSGNIVLFGQIVNRSIIYSEIPQYPEWAKRKGIEGDVRMKFWVTSDGKVFNVSIIKKSPDLRLDLLAKNTIIKWKFSPLDKNVSQQNQWGEILVKFVLY